MKINNPFFSGLQDRVPGPGRRRSVASGERLPGQGHNVHLLQSVERARVRVQDTGEERGRFQQAEPVLAAVQAEEQVQRALATRYPPSRQGWQELRRPEVGGAHLRWG